MKAEENTEKNTKKYAEGRSTLKWNEIFSLCDNPIYKYSLIIFFHISI